MKKSRAKMTEDNRPFATAKEVAEYLGCSADTVYRLANSKKIRSVRIGKLIRIPWREAESYRDGLD